MSPVGLNASKVIPLVVCTDNHYAILLATLLKSIETNHHTNEHILVYVIDDGISEKNKEKLIENVSQEMFSFEFIPLSLALPKGTLLPVPSGLFPMNIYLRLFIPKFINPDFEKVLYLDVDMVMLKDISDLYNVPLIDHTLAAVGDQRVKTFDNSWGGVLNYKKLNLSPKSLYFNTGLLLINAKRWNDEKVAENVIKIIFDNIEFAQYPDQYGLNVFFANNWKQLDSGWNQFSSEKPLPEIGIIHYISRKPIYLSYSGRDEYKEIFNSYLNQTVFNKFVPIGEASRYVKKVAVAIRNFKRYVFQKFS